MERESAKTPASLMWSPDPVKASQTAMAEFLAHASQASQDAGGPALSDYAELHAWSIEHFETFWQSWLRYTELIVSGSDTAVYTDAGRLGGNFFPDIKLNFAENLLRHKNDDVALVSISESRDTIRLTYNELHAQVAQLRVRLTDLGIAPGDRVAGFLPNVSEAVVAMLAATSLGAIWTSCSPDFGPRGVVDRFGQTEPKVLFAVTAYHYNGKRFDCADKVEKITEELPSLEAVILLDTLSETTPSLPGYDLTSGRLIRWSELLSAGADADSDNVPWSHFPFNHPLYILYSSGTTGVPKCIVHGAGGTLLQHTKELVLHCDLRAGDNITYFTTCGWMMWNWLVSALTTGATVTLFDGSPTFPSIERLWDMVAAEKITHFGTSPKFIGACRDKVKPCETSPAAGLRVLMSTGAPLLPEDFDWIYDSVKEDLQVSSISGGTDIVSCFMLGNPLLPVHRGEIQCFGLGMDVAALGASEERLVGTKGELACCKPFPSMPVAFWDDPEDVRYRKSYFRGTGSTWFHGDYIEVTGSQGECGGVVVYGRSDATLNPGGVRIGTAEIYRLVETLPEIADSIVVGQTWQSDVRVVLFVRLGGDARLSDALSDKIKRVIRAGSSPRHVPAVILTVDDIPYTMSGKKVELAVRQIIEGEEPKNKEALANPESLAFFRNRPELVAR